MTGLGTVTAGYTLDGQRAWKQTGSARTYFFYSRGVPVFETDSLGTVNAVNTFGVNGLASRRTASGSVFYLFNQHGDTAQRLNALGGVISAHAQDAYGSNASTVITDDPYDGYGAQWGYRTDHETGLMLLGHRYYDPAHGRFLNRDPAGHGSGLNLYRYCGNDPVNQLDPSGFDPSLGAEWANTMDESAADANAYWAGALGKDSFGFKGLSTGINFVTGIGTTAMRLGYGSGKFAGDPTWENSLGVVGDVATVATLGEFKSASVIADELAVVVDAPGVAIKEAAAETPEVISEVEDASAGLYVRRVNEAREIYPNLAGQIEDHHIIPKYMGGPANGATVPLDRAYHVWLHQKLYAEAGEVVSRDLKAHEVHEILRGFYHRFPLPPGTKLGV